MLPLWRSTIGWKLQSQCMVCWLAGWLSGWIVKWCGLDLRSCVGIVRNKISSQNPQRLRYWKGHRNEEMREMSYMYLNVGAQAEQSFFLFFLSACCVLLCLTPPTTIVVSHGLIKRFLTMQRSGQKNLAERMTNSKATQSASEERNKSNDRISGPLWTGAIWGSCLEWCDCRSENPRCRSSFRVQEQKMPPWTKFGVGNWRCKMNWRQMILWILCELFWYPRTLFAFRLVQKIPSRHPAAVILLEVIFHLHSTSPLDLQMCMRGYPCMCISYLLCVFLKFCAMRLHVYLVNAPALFCFNHWSGLTQWRRIQRLSDWLNQWPNPKL